MGMSLLRNKIEFGEDTAIRIDPSFVFQDYRRLIKELFRKHRKYFVEDNDDSCDVEDEDELIKQTVSDLCDILSRPQNNLKPRKNDLMPNDVKLRILLIKHTVEGLGQKISTFVKHIESMVQNL